MQSSTLQAPVAHTVERWVASLPTPVARKAEGDPCGETCDGVAVCRATLPMKVSHHIAPSALPATSPAQVKRTAQVTHDDGSSSLHESSLRGAPNVVCASPRSKATFSLSLCSEPAISWPGSLGKPGTDAFETVSAGKGWDSEDDFLLPRELGLNFWEHAERSMGLLP